MIHKYYNGDSWREIDDVQCRHVSKVWSDIINLGDPNFVHSSVFKDSFKWCLGDEKAISFWNNSWCGTSPLCIVFPRLFNHSIAKDCSIKDLYSYVDGTITWNLNLRRPPSGREATEERELINLLSGIQIKPDVADSRQWSVGGSKPYSASKTYSLLLSKN